MEDTNTLVNLCVFSYSILILLINLLIDLHIHPFIIHLWCSRILARRQTSFKNYTKIISLSSYVKSCAKERSSNAAFGHWPWKIGWYLWGLWRKNEYCSQDVQSSPIKQIKPSEGGEQRVGTSTQPAKSLTLPFMTSKIIAKNRRSINFLVT